MSEAHRTIEGWYALHDMRRIDWRAWQALSQQEQQEAVREAVAFLERAERALDAAEGSSAAFAMLGHKADLMLLHLRPTVEDLLQLELEFARTALAAVTERTTSYVSVTELGQYTTGEPQAQPDPQKQAFIERRLKFRIPDDMPYVSFYPMSKKREGADNWYTLPLERRREMMYSHGAVGRAYRGQVQQLVTGSMGMDDWEWGVTLFATDALPIKKIVQEMRFDEASARYGLFGPFYFGVRLRAAALESFMAGRFVRD